MSTIRSLAQPVLPATPVVLTKPPAAPADAAQQAPPVQTLMVDLNPFIKDQSKVAVQAGREASFNPNQLQIKTLAANVIKQIEPLRKADPTATRVEIKLGDQTISVPLSKLDRLLKAAASRGRAYAGMAGSDSSALHIEHYYAAETSSPQRTADALMFLAKARG